MSSLAHGVGMSSQAPKYSEWLSARGAASGWKRECCPPCPASVSLSDADGRTLTIESNATYAPSSSHDSCPSCSLCVHCFRSSVAGCTAQEDRPAAVAGAGGQGSDEEDRRRSGEETAPMSHSRIRQPLCHLNTLRSSFPARVGALPQAASASLPSRFPLAHCGFPP